MRRPNVLSATRSTEDKSCHWPLVYPPDYPVTGEPLPLRFVQMESSKRQRTACLPLVPEDSRFSLSCPSSVPAWKGPENRFKALHEASAAGVVAEVKRLVERMPTAEFVQCVLPGDASERTPLMRASDNGRLGVVDFFLDRHRRNRPRLKLPGRDATGATALILAVRKGHTNVVKSLLQYMGPGGVKAKDCDGRTALHEAAAHGSAEIVDLLLKHKANPSAKDRQGREPWRVVGEKKGGLGELKQSLATRLKVGVGARPLGC
jgi:hypothetical protein